MKGANPLPMSNDALDIAVARFVRQTGLASAEQVAAAMQVQSRGAERGEMLSLTEALVRQGILTAAQREMVERKAQAQKAVITELLHYKLLKKLGEGGMGAVYLAEDLKMNRRVAVKILPRKLAGNPEILKRFRREAGAAAALKHRHIVGAYEFGEDIGYSFYVMEYCDGETLDATLKRDGHLPVRRAIELTLQSAQGLKYAHDQGFIHRDIKPANIFLTRDGVAKILDLGLSKNIDEGEQSFKTVTGAILGTPHYISPEQAQGEKGLDGRTDIYSLGATFYHLLTGSTPFDGTTIFEILSKQVSAQLPNPQDLQEDIPDGVVHVMRRMMAKSPDDRYRDCGELAEDLRQVLEGNVPVTRILDPQLSAVALQRKKAHPRRPPTVRREAAPPPPPKSRTKLAIGIAAAIGLGLVATLTLSRSGKEEPKKPAAVPLGRKETAELRPPTKAPDPGLVVRTVELLTQVDPARDSVRGKWLRVGEELSSGPGENQLLLLPYHPPEEYDFHVSFTPQGGAPDVNMILSKSGRAFQAYLGAFSNTLFGFSFRGAAADKHPLTVKRTRCLEGGRRYVALVKVRNGSVELILDGESILKHETNYSDLTLSNMPVPDETRLGITSWKTLTSFHRIAVTEISGRGSMVFQPPAAVPEGAVFRERLEAPWVDRSWECEVSFDSETQALEGTRSIQFRPKKSSAGLYLGHPVGLDASPYTHLTFAVWSASAEPKLAISLYLENGEKKAVGLEHLGGFPPLRAWKKYVVPLSSLVGVERKITGVVFQSFASASDVVVYIDALAFLKVP